MYISRESIANLPNTEKSSYFVQQEVECSVHGPRIGADIRPAKCDLAKRNHFPRMNSSAVKVRPERMRAACISKPGTRAEHGFLGLVLHEAEPKSKQSKILRLSLCEALVSGEHERIYHVRDPA